MPPVVRLLRMDRMTLGEGKGVTGSGGGHSDTAAAFDGFLAQVQGNGRAKEFDDGRRYRIQDEVAYDT